jgi:N-acyl-D-amino-acid deacylase
MVALLREGMAAGAIGMSSGVFYATGAAADIEELALLARVVGDAGGVYTSHIRDEFDRVLDSLDEAVRDGSTRSLPVVISHHKCAGPQNWGRTVETLAHFDAARSAQPIGSMPIRTSPARPCCAPIWSTASSTSSSPGRCRIRK